MIGDLFEKWVYVDWPHEIPNDCTNLDNDRDCLEKNLPALCPSCWEYSRRIEVYYSDWIKLPVNNV